MRRRNAISAGIASAAVIAVGAGAAFAVGGIPDSTNDGTIHGCYQKNEGQLRVIDKSAGDSCRGSERPIEWSKNGGPPSVYFREVKKPAGNSDADRGTAVANNKFVDASCDAGDVVTGGGVYVGQARGFSGEFTNADLANHINIVENRKLGGSSTTWRARASEVPYDTNPVGQKGWRLVSQVYCLDLTP